METDLALIDGMNTLKYVCEMHRLIGKVYLEQQSHLLDDYYRIHVLHTLWFMITGLQGSLSPHVDTYNLAIIKNHIDTHIHCTLWTYHSCIFTVITVVSTNSIMSAITQDCLISTAVHIIQENGSSSRTKDAIVVCTSDCYCNCN